MVRSLALLVLVGCGRFGFGGTDDAGTDDAVIDGTPVVIDLCPELVGDQEHDEDGDSVGDECDRCPHIAGTDVDLDNDGVGDACDPSVGTAERIRAFATFETGAPAGWTNTWRGTTGELAFTGDAARFELARDDVGFLTMPDPGMPILLVETRFTVEAISPNEGNPARNFAIVDGYDVQADSGLMYGPVYDHNSPAAFGLFIIEVLNSVGNDTFDEDPIGGGFSFGVPYALRFVRQSDQRTVILNEPSQRYMGSTTRPLTQGGLIGLRSRGLRVRIDYAIVIY
ncbi:MAG: hypothetical protein SFX73_25715 [Kofleriaceae bacterium]|nr:hypothetical protein [Kofleriaceae bacterium]